MCDYDVDECECEDRWGPEGKPTKPKYEKTYCSQCGGEFGPGEHGYSHCSDHKHSRGFDADLAVSIARGGMGPEEMCVEYFDKIAQLKDALRACLRAFEAGKDVPGAVVPREKFLDELRALVR